MNINNLLGLFKSVLDGDDESESILADVFEEKEVQSPQKKTVYYAVLTYDRILYFLNKIVMRESNIFDSMKDWILTTKMYPREITVILSIFDNLDDILFLNSCYLDELYYLIYWQLLDEATEVFEILKMNANFLEKIKKIDNKIYDYKLERKDEWDVDVCSKYLKEV